MVRPEYIKVRGYIHKLIENSDERDLRIPSENELCRMFSVSRITVRAAIRQLVDEKFLIPQRGVGTFINPEKAGGGNFLSQRKTIGLISHDGRGIFISEYEDAIYNGIHRSGMVCEMLYLPDSCSPERMLESMGKRIDAIIWLGLGQFHDSPKYLKAFKNNGIPVLKIETDVPPLPDDDNIIFSSPQQRGEALAEHIFQNGCNSMLFVHNFTPAHLPSVIGSGSPHDSCINKLAELSQKDPLVKCVSMAQFHEMLKDKKEIHDYPVIYSLASLAPSVMRMLESFHLRVPEDISYVVYGNSDAWFFNGLSPDFIDYKYPICRGVIEWLDMRLTHGLWRESFIRQIQVRGVKGQTCVPKQNHHN